MKAKLLRQLKNSGVKALDKTTATAEVLKQVQDDEWDVKERKKERKKERSTQNLKNSLSL